MVRGGFSGKPALRLGTDVHGKVFSGLTLLGEGRKMIKASVEASADPMANMSYCLGKKKCLKQWKFFIGKKNKAIINSK